MKKKTAVKTKAVKAVNPLVAKRNKDNAVKDVENAVIALMKSKYWTVLEQNKEYVVSAMETALGIITVKNTGTKTGASKVHKVTHGKDVLEFNNISGAMVARLIVNKMEDTDETKIDYIAKLRDDRLANNIMESTLNCNAVKWLNGRGYDLFDANGNEIIGK